MPNSMSEHHFVKTRLYAEQHLQQGLLNIAAYNLSWPALQQQLDPPTHNLGLLHNIGLHHMDLHVEWGTHLGA